LKLPSCTSGVRLKPDTTGVAFFGSGVAATLATARAAASVSDGAGLSGTDLFEPGAAAGGPAGAGRPTDAGAGIRAAGAETAGCRAGGNGGRATGFSGAPTPAMRSSIGISLRR